MLSSPHRITLAGAHSREAYTRSLDRAGHANLPSPAFRGGKTTSLPSGEIAVPATRTSLWLSAGANGVLCSAARRKDRMDRVGTSSCAKRQMIAASAARGPLWVLAHACAGGVASCTVLLPLRRGDAHTLYPGMHCPATTLGTSGLAEGQIHRAVTRRRRLGSRLTLSPVPR